MNVYVIGAGSSGLTCAIVLARRGFKVYVIEQNNKIGKKLLLTGNGRCNYWNENQEITKYHSKDLDIFKIIYNNTKEEVLPFFQSIGIMPRINNGYYYPCSNQAISVVNALVATAKNLKVQFITEEKVLNLKKTTKWEIITDKNKYLADKVVLAMGSKAYLKNDIYNGYELIKKLGHNLTSIYPALVPLIGDNNFLKDLAGVRSEVILNLYIDKQLKAQEFGEVQFTDRGISGICSFNLSGMINESIAKEKTVEIGINLVPWFKKNKEALIEFLDNQEQVLTNYTLSNILEGFLNYKIVNVILKKIKKDINTKWQEVNKEEVVNILMDFKIKVIGTKDYDNAQICRGGVVLKEINPYTMESLKVKDIYLVGELLDVDGVCGGYNLGFAWMSGIAAGKGIK